MSDAAAGARSWELRHTAIVLLALAVGAAGSVSLPLDDHEVFVVQTAQEMRERHDWVVPHFLGTPRLNKPPLSYWLVAGLAEATASQRVAPWQGRAPSILAGAGVVALAMVMALALADGTTAAVAGLIAASSVGLFRYTHSARPDMLYAFWCTLMLATFTCRWPSPLLWLSVALATLTKGPQFPAMVLVAIVVAERRRGTTLRALGQRLRPLVGITMALALTLPWWWAVQRALGGRALAGSQLGGSLLLPSAAALLDPYFFYRPVALILPSAVIVALALVWRRWPAKPRDVMWWLACFVVVPAIAFTVGPQRRPHYMLPALAPMCVLLALIACTVLEAARTSARGRWIRGAVGMLWAVTITSEVALGGSSLLWSKERFVSAELGTLAARALPATTPLFALDTAAAAPSYYARRPVRPVRSMTRVTAALATAPEQTVGLLTERRSLERLPRNVRVRIVGSGAVDAENDLVLVELHAATVRPNAPDADRRMDRR
jgi:4-amino-4-deoxy-L-arabinose transferase-like glycosyltransferase